MKMIGAHTHLNTIYQTLQLDTCHYMLVFDKTQVRES